MKNVRYFFVKLVQNFLISIKFFVINIPHFLTVGMRKKACEIFPLDKS